MKYIPGESIAFYAFVDTIIKTTSDDALPFTHWREVVAWTLFVIAAVGTYPYLRSRRIPGQPWRLNAVLGTVAFPLWAYTLHGTVFDGWHYPLVAALTAPVFTFIAGCFTPR